MGEILRGVSREYGWPVHHPVPRDTIALTPEARAAVVGTYHAGPPGGITLEVSEVDVGLLTRAPTVGWRKRTLMAASTDTLFVLEGSVDLAVERDDRETVTALVLVGAGPPLRFERR